MAAFLVLLRISVLLLFLPVLGYRFIPSQVKIGLIGLISILLYPVVIQNIPEIPASPVMFALLCMQEIMIAGMMALLAQLILASVQLAGQLMSYQMGMAIANVFDPATSAQVAIVGQLAVTLAMMMWLAVGAHHIFLYGLVDSFQLMPIGQPWSIHGWDALNQAAGNMFKIALQLVAPMLLMMFFVYVALGLTSRAVPQIQVFFVSFPLTVGLGFLTFALAMPVFMMLLHDQFMGLSTVVPNFLKALAL
ncbi:MAG: flagellar biosynthetic protein FliR [Mariprofundaceae bacterium]